MTSFVKLKLSGSTDGKGIKVTATAIGSGDTIHTAQATTTSGLGDNITIFAQNNDTTNRILTLGWGGTTDPDDLIIQTVTAKSGLALIVADLFLWNSLVVKAACDVASKVTLFGYVNRIQ